jgi:hypothetical protein
MTADPLGLQVIPLVRRMHYLQLPDVGTSPDRELPVDWLLLPVDVEKYG